MNDTFHPVTMIWGVFLTITGAALAAVGLGWWDITMINVGYLAPLLLIVLGAIVLVGALVRRERA